MQKGQLISEDVVRAFLMAAMRGNSNTTRYEPQLSELEKTYFSLLTREFAEAALAFLENKLDPLVTDIQLKLSQLLQEDIISANRIWKRFHECLSYCGIKKQVNATDKIPKQSDDLNTLTILCDDLEQIADLKQKHRIIWTKKKGKRKKLSNAAKDKKANYAKAFTAYIDILFAEASKNYGNKQDFVMQLINSISRGNSQLKDECLKSIKTIEQLMCALDISVRLNLKLDDSHLGQLLTWMTSNHFQSLNIMSSFSFSDKEFDFLARIVKNYAVCLSFVYKNENFVTKHNPQNKHLLEMYQAKVVEVSLFGLCVVDKQTKINQLDEAKKTLAILESLSKHYNTTSDQTGVLYCEMLDEKDINYKIGFELQNEEEAKQNALTAQEIIQLVRLLKFQAHSSDVLDPQHIETSTKNLFSLIRGALKQQKSCDSGLLDSMWKSAIAEHLSTWLNTLKDNAPEQKAGDLQEQFSDPLLKKNPWLEPILIPQKEVVELPIKEEENKKEDEIIVIRKNPPKQLTIEDSKKERVSIKKPKVNVFEAEKPQPKDAQQPKEIHWSSGYSFPPECIFSYTPIFSKRGRYFTTLCLDAKHIEHIDSFTKLLERGRPGSIVFFQKKNYREHDGHIYIAKARKKGDWRVWAWGLLNSKGQTLLIFDWLLNHKQQKAVIENGQPPKNSM